MHDRSRICTLGTDIPCPMRCVAWCEERYTGRFECRIQTFTLVECIAFERRSGYGLMVRECVCEDVQIDKVRVPDFDAGRVVMHMVRSGVGRWARRAPADHGLECGYAAPVPHHNPQMRPKQPFVAATHHKINIRRIYLDDPQ